MTDYLYISESSKLFNQSFIKLKTRSAQAGPESERRAAARVRAGQCAAAHASPR